jgi:hypothetical protein
MVGTLLRQIFAVHSKPKNKAFTDESRTFFMESLYLQSVSIRLLDRRMSLSISESLDVLWRPAMGIAMIGIAVVFLDASLGLVCVCDQLQHGGRR